MGKGARFCHNCGWDSKLAAAGAASASAGRRPAWKRWVMGVSLGLSGALMLLLLLIPRGDANETLVPGQPAPDFNLTSLEGEQVRLSALKGRPVVVNFWASWCTPCRKEMPEFEAVQAKYGDQGLQVYGINVGESKVAVTNFRDQVGVTFPILIDTDESVQNAYKILPLPATFFIDRAGVIRAIYPFQMSQSQIDDEVVRLLTR